MIVPIRPSSWTLLRILLHGKSSLRFILGVILSFSFSISVILGTVGIMDGFDDALKRGLRLSSGDFTVYHRGGFFNYDVEARSAMEKLGIEEVAPLVQTEGFLVFGETSKGILIKGIDPQSFNKVTGLDVTLQKNEIVVGAELYRQLQLKEGDKVVLMLANGNAGFSSLPRLRSFEVKKSVEHGIYKKDLRFVYVAMEVLQELLNLGQKVNLIALNVPLDASMKDISTAQDEYLNFLREYEYFLRNILGPWFVVRPFWHEFNPLIEAVKVEKFTIGLILQLVVVISIFNIVAFITFLNERRSQEIFLFQALGMSKKRLTRVWLALVFLIWVISCVLSIFLGQIFDWGLGHLSFLKMPGEVYNLSRLSLKLGPMDYFYVFSLALFWVLVIAMIGIYRLKKKSILSGLRKEFS